MLNQQRLKRVKEEMRISGCEQMLVTDPVAIFYLTGKWLYPGERFLALYIGANETPVLYLNELFRFDEEIGVSIHWITDTSDLVKELSTSVQSDQPLGIDKEMAAKFLLLLIDAKLGSSFHNTSLAIDHSRAIKDAQEITWMRESSLINDRAMEQFKGLIHEGVYEDEIADQMLKIYQSLGASAYSFDPIVSFGIHSTDPHHSPDHTMLKPGEHVLLDVGCRYQDYCSDMTRVFFFQKAPEGEDLRIYNLVRQANEEAEEMCKAGIPLCSIDAKAREIITEGGYGPDFTHRLGHFIGIQDHDFGDVSTANTNLTQVGNTFSIEPGIYNPAHIGVRIEDLVLITEEGHEVLNHYPHDIEVIG